LFKDHSGKKTNAAVWHVISYHAGVQTFLLWPNGEKKKSEAT